MDKIKHCTTKCTQARGRPGRGEKKFLLKEKTKNPLTVTIYKVEAKSVSPKSILNFSCFFSPGVEVTSVY